LAHKLGLYVGLKDVRRVAPEANPALLKEFRKNPKSPDRILKKFPEMEPAQIQRWWRKQRNFETPTPLTKFKESFWRFFFYSAMLIYGVIVMWDKPWLWDTDLFWVSSPKALILTL
jgi:hypothetical protein